MVALA